MSAIIHTVMNQVRMVAFVIICESCDVNQYMYKDSVGELSYTNRPLDTHSALASTSIND